MSIEGERKRADLGVPIGSALENRRGTRIDRFVVWIDDLIKTSKSSVDAAVCGATALQTVHGAGSTFVKDMRDRGHGI